jgi:type VII secretion protein EccE
MTTSRVSARAEQRRVRAVARVSNGQARRGVAILAPRRRPGYLGPVHVFQLLLIEAVLLGVVLTVSRGPVMVAGVAVSGLLLMGVTLSRRRGRWWLETRLISSRYRYRRRIRPARAIDPRLAALRALAPGLTVRDVAAPDGTRVGVARDDSGWYAVSTVSPTAAMRDDPAAGLPLDRLVRTVHEAGQAGGVLQVVTHTVPAPSTEVDRGCAAEQSYRELLQASGQGPLPRDRVTWIAVRVDARSMAEDLPEDGDGPEPPAVVVGLIRRVAKTLRGTGRECQVLDADGVLAALARSCDLEPSTRAGAPVAGREDWAAWHSARLAHASFWVRDFPPVGQVGALLDGVSTVPSAMTSIALILAPDGDLIDLRCLARVAAPAKVLPQVCLGLVRGAEEARARLFRLDGEHGPGVYATAPTGGGAR